MTYKKKRQARAAVSFVLLAAATFGLGASISSAGFGPAQGVVNPGSSTPTSSGWDVVLGNNAHTNVHNPQIDTGDLLQFGGATNSFAALKPNGTTLALRLADDSGAASLSFGPSTLTAAGQVALGASNGVAWSGRSLIQSLADGDVLLTNNAVGSFGKLQLGGTSNLFPAVKRNSAALNFRLADDSADASITAGDGTFTGSGTNQKAFLSTPTASSGLPSGIGGSICLGRPSDAGITFFWAATPNGGSAQECGIYGQGGTPGTAAASRLRLGGDGGTAIYSGQSLASMFGNARGNAGWLFSSDGNTLALNSAGVVGWSSSADAGGTVDLALARDAANTPAWRNGTNPQAWRLYGTFTDAANYERFAINTAAGTYTIGTEVAGTGVPRAISIKAANQPAGSAAGVDLNITSGDSGGAGGQAGAINVTGGVGSTINGQNGGNLNFISGAGNASGGRAGFIQLLCGTSTGNFQGSGLTITAGNAEQSGAGGNGSNGGNLLCTAGASSNTNRDQNGGLAKLTGGKGTLNGGAVSILGGDGQARPDGLQTAVGGAILTQGGASLGTNVAGPSNTMASGTSTGAGQGGSLIFQASPKVSGGSSGTGSNSLVTILTIAPVMNNLTGTNNLSSLSATFANGGTTSSSTINRLDYGQMTLNYTGTKTDNVTMFGRDLVETSDPSGTILLMDLRAGSAGTTSQFKVTNAGAGTFAGALVCTSLNAGSGLITTTGNYSAGSSGVYVWAAQSRMSSPSDGVIMFQNNGTSAFTRLNFGGTTSSFAALQTSGTTLTVGTADGGTSAGALAISGTTTHTGDVLFASNGTVSFGAASSGIKKLFADYTNTATVGNVTINKASGRVIMAAATSAFTVTNSLVTAASHVMVTMSSAPGNALGVSVWTVPAAGSFTINTSANLTNQTTFDYFVVGAD